MTPPAAPHAFASRRLMREIREIMAARVGAQERLDRFVRVVALNLVGDVCSVYLRRAGGAMELCATHGLAAAAVHHTRLAAGEGLVGVVVGAAAPLVAPDARRHPAFFYKEETGEDDLQTFLGVPILRGGRLLGVLTLQNQRAVTYGEEEVESLQTAAMILAEIVVAPELGFLSAFEGIELKPSRPERLIGRRVAEGVVIGTAVRLEPHVPTGRLIADNPEAEAGRLHAALEQLRLGVDALLQGRVDALGEQPREALEAYRMIAHDPGWLARLEEAVRLGLTAEAAVERVRSEQRARMTSARDPYLRDRLHDLEDLANQLLRRLGESAEGGRREPPRWPPDPVLVARDVGPAELLDLADRGVKGVLVEEGAPTSHAAIVARALGLAMVGRLDGVLDRVEDGDTVVVDGARGEAHLRPPAEVLETYRAKIALRGQARAAFEALRDVPAVTRDGRRVKLLLNAGLLVDLPQLDRAGADGIGLFRTEFQFLIADAMPRRAEQAALYRAALEAAGDRPVTFRTLDLGGDKILPYVDAEKEENPAMGLRAVRLALDRPYLMRHQLRALVAAAGAAKRPLQVMFPLVSTVEEFRAARALMDLEIALAARRGWPRPERVSVGAMVETPAIALSIDALLAEADFVSVGANDLFQFLFAVDRGHPKLADRYDVLSPPMLRLLGDIAAAAERAGRPVSICGEVAGRPLEAMALIALGFSQLSMPASGIGPVKRLVLGLDAARAGQAVRSWFGAGDASLRPRAEALAAELGLTL